MSPVPYIYILEENTRQELRENPQFETLTLLRWTEPVYSESWTRDVRRSAWGGTLGEYIPFPVSNLIQLLDYGIFMAGLQGLIYRYV